MAQNIYTGLIVNGLSSDTQIFSVNSGATSVFNVGYDGKVGIGNISPISKLHIQGIDNSIYNYALKVEDYLGTNLLSMRNDGDIFVGQYFSPPTAPFSDPNFSLFYRNLQILSQNPNDHNGIYLCSNAAGGGLGVVQAAGASAYAGASIINGSISITGIWDTPVLVGTNQYSVATNPSVQFYSLQSGTYVATTDHVYARFLNNGNFGLGYGLATPTAKLHVQGSTHDTTAYALNAQDDLGAIIMSIRNDGLVLIDGLTVGKGGGFVASNTAFGVNALLNNIIGLGSTAVGSNSLSSSNTNYNTALGYNSLNSMTGGENTAVGALSMVYGTTGSANVAIGQGSLLYNNGSSNVAVGSYSMINATSADQNTAIGRESLQGISSAFGNVAVGRRSGYLNLTGNNNVFIGYNSGFYETTSNNLYIHNGLGGFATTAQERVASLIYGVFDADPANQKLFFNSEVSVSSLSGATGITRTVTVDSTGKLIAGGAVPTGSTIPNLSAVTSQGNTTADDIEITDYTKGIILRSSDNSRWRVTIDNSGSLITTSI